MSFGPAITATIGADVAPLAAAGPQVEDAAGKIGAKLTDKLIGARDVANVVATALGLNLEKIAESVSAYVFGVTEEAKKDFEALADTAEKTTAIVQEQLAKRRDQTQEHQHNLQQEASLERDMNGLKQQQIDKEQEIAKLKAQALAYALAGPSAAGATLAVDSEINRATNELLGIQQKIGANQKDQQALKGTFDAEDQDRMKKTYAWEQGNWELGLRNLTLKQQAVAWLDRENERLKEWVAFKGEGVEKDILRHQADIAHLKYTELTGQLEKEARTSQFEQLELEAKLMSGTISPNERIRLDIIRLQNEALVVHTKLQQLLSKPIAEWNQADKDQFSALEKQNGKIAEQIEAKKKLLDETKKVAAEENKIPPAIEAAFAATKEFSAGMAEIFKQMENISAEWEQFKGSITTFGRSDKDLSDRELQRKVSNINRDIFQRRTADATAPGSAYYNPSAPGTDLLLEAQMGNLQQTLAELKLRETVRRDASAFGQDAAFRMHDGLNEQRFAEILRTATDSQTVVDELKGLRTDLRTGRTRIGTVSL
jgi:hypothetical protein